MTFSSINLENKSNNERWQELNAFINELTEKLNRLRLSSADDEKTDEDACLSLCHPLHIAEDEKSLGLGQLTKGGDGQIWVGWQTHLNTGLVSRTIWQTSESDPSWTGIASKPCDAQTKTFTLYLVTYTDTTAKNALLLRCGTVIQNDDFVFTVSDTAVTKVSSVGTLTGLYALI